MWSISIKLVIDLIDQDILCAVKIMKTDRWDCACSVFWPYGNILDGITWCIHLLHWIAETQAQLGGISSIWAGGRLKKPGGICCWQYSNSQSTVSCLLVGRELWVFFFFFFIMLTITTLFFKSLHSFVCRWIWMHYMHLQHFSHFLMMQICQNVHGYRLKTLSRYGFENIQTFGEVHPQ